MKDVPEIDPFTKKTKEHKKVVEKEEKKAKRNEGKQKKDDLLTNKDAIDETI